MSMPAQPLSRDQRGPFPGFSCDNAPTDMDMGPGYLNRSSIAIKIASRISPPIMRANKLSINLPRRQHRSSSDCQIILDSWPCSAPFDYTGGILLSPSRWGSCASHDQACCNYSRPFPLDQAPYYCQYSLSWYDQVCHSHSKPHFLLYNPGQCDPVCCICSTFALSHLRLCILGLSDLVDYNCNRSDCWNYALVWIHHLLQFHVQCSLLTCGRSCHKHSIRHFFHWGSFWINGLLHCSCSMILMRLHYHHQIWADSGNSSRCVQLHYSCSKICPLPGFCIHVHSVLPDYIYSKWSYWQCLNKQSPSLIYDLDLSW